LHASAAPDAPIYPQGRLRGALPAFGIVAPSALQRAALEKDRRADAGAIVYGVPLYVEDQSSRLKLGTMAEATAGRPGHKFTPIFSVLF